MEAKGFTGWMIISLQKFTQTPVVHTTGLWAVFSTKIISSLFHSGVPREVPGKLDFITIIPLQTSLASFLL